MAGQRKLKKAYRRLDKKKADEITVIPGILGFPINGVNTVEVRNRNGYVYVRLRDNQSEVVQAFNTNVSPVYGLPVLIIRDKINKSRYSVLSRDIGRYENWGTSSPYLPRHGAQHSFDPTAVGGDIVWVYNRQFMPLNVYPSGSFGSMNVLISPTTYYRNGLWHYAGETGTASFAGYKPTGSSARMVLVSLDNFDNPQLTPGSFFASTLTGTSQIFSYIPQVPAIDNIPIAAIRLVSGTSIINWDNIYDVRPFFMASGFQSTGTSGHTIADEGTPLANRPTLNFIGANVWAQDNAGSNRTDIIISGTSSDNITNNYYSTPNTVSIFDNGIFSVSGTAISFDDGLVVSVSGTVAYINSTGTSSAFTGTVGHIIEDETTPLTQRSKLSFQGAGVVATDDAGNNRTIITIPGATGTIGASTNNILPIYNNNIFIVTGTAAIFNDNLTVSVSGTMAYIKANAGVGAGLNVVSVLDNSTFRVSGSVFSFDNGLYVSVTGSVAYINVSGTSSTTDANHPYYQKLASFLEPDAIEPLQVNTFSYVIASGTTKYLMASWNTRLGSFGRMEVRDPREPLPLRDITLSGIGAGAAAVIIDPTIPSYTNARTTYFDRLEELSKIQTKYIAVSGTADVGPFLPGPYGSIILQVTNFDYAWIILRPYGATIGYNIANEVSDSATQRNSNKLNFPVNKNIVSLYGASNHNGSGGIVYAILPSTWSAVSDPNVYDFRDDFMGASLDAASIWTRNQSAAGNVEIDTKFQWLKAIGNGSWGQNGIYSQSYITKANGKVFLADVFINTYWDANGFGIIGFSDGAGNSYSNLAYGINFGANVGSPQLNIYENGNARGAVGSAYSLGSMYRVRITCTSGNNAVYEIQGGAEYPAIGGNSWTDITPGTTSSATTQLHTGVSMFKNTMWIGDVKMY